MLTKLFKIAGIVACITMMAACFIPWVYYDDIHQTFTGYYSYQNQYGKPGKFLTIIAAVVLVFTLVPKIWAKRTNMFVAALGVGYAVKTYVLFTSCYSAYCPDKKLGIYLMLISSIVMLASSVVPDLKLSPSPSSAVAKTDGDVNS